MDNIILRNARLDDIDNGLLKAYTYGYKYHQNNRSDIFDDLSISELRSRLIKDFDRLLIRVVLKNNEVIGYISFEIKEKKYKKLYIDQLAVREEFQKQGFGGLLINEVKRFGLENNCKIIELNCWLFNTDALDMYEHKGFNKQRIIYEMKLN